MSASGQWWCSGHSIGHSVRGSSVCTWGRPAIHPDNHITHNWVKGNTNIKLQSWGFTSHSTARVILGQVLSIDTCRG